MRRLGLALCALFWMTSSSLWAQVKVELSLKQKRFLPHERIFVTVKLTNFTGRDLRFSPTSEWLRFYAESTSRKIVPKKSPVTVEADWVVKSSEVATIDLNVEPFYDFSSLDRYRLRASVWIEALRREFSSDEVTFHVFPGVKIWEQVFGMPPDPEKPEVAPELRKYALIQYKRTDKPVLYFRLTNPEETKTFEVYPFGTSVSFSLPECLIDMRGRLHVLNQFDAKRFGYTEFTTAGKRAVHQTYVYADQSRPRLTMDNGGKGIVIGGRRQFRATDYPRSQSVSTVN